MLIAILFYSIIIYLFLSGPWWPSKSHALKEKLLDSVAMTNVLCFDAFKMHLVSLSRAHTHRCSCDATMWPRFHFQICLYNNLVDISTKWRTARQTLQKSLFEDISLPFLAPHFPSQIAFKYKFHFSSLRRLSRLVQSCSPRNGHETYVNFSLSDPYFLQSHL